MYITLDFIERSRDLKYRRIDLSNLPKPKSIPKKLIRIDDMKEVDGINVNEGYCALSYAWSQSGDIIYNKAKGKCDISDKGNHKIISDDKLYSVLWDYMWWKIPKILKFIYYFKKTTKNVKFKRIIQRICQEFNIKYIWYDQMCINQKNKEEKQREIRHMHLIYSNAYCTIALVPEFKVNYSSYYSDDFNRRLSHFGTNGEEYFKRLWTLEEAIKSERLLFVGENIHRWVEDITSIYDNIKILNKPSSELSVSQILHHAHQRTSTNEHDRVFALIHLFPEFMQDIDIDYDQPLEDLMIRFYGLLAKKDISILLFDNILYRIPYNSTIQKYEFLPSWTGVNGKHVTEYATTSFQNYDIIGKTMHVTSKIVTNCCQLIDNNDALTIRKEDLPPHPGDINVGDNKRCYCLCISVQLPGTSDTINVSLLYSFDDTVLKKECFDGISKYVKRLSRFMETKKENLYWCHEDREEYQKAIHIDLDHLTEDMDNLLSAQYIILSEVSFKGEGGDLHYPVIIKKQGEEYYKAIGYCSILMKNDKDIFSDCNLPKQTFSIQ